MTITIKMTTSSEAEHWEDIPKAAHNIYKKKADVTDALRNASSQFQKSKSITILENIQKANETRIANNQPLVKHGNLYSLVYSKDLLRIAFRKLSKNRGAMTSMSGIPKIEDFCLCFCKGLDRRSSMAGIPKIFDFWSSRSGPRSSGPTIEGHRGPPDLKALQPIRHPKNSLIKYITLLKTELLYGPRWPSIVEEGEILRSQSPSPEPVQADVVVESTTAVVVPTQPISPTVVATQSATQPMTLVRPTLPNNPAPAGTAPIQVVPNNPAPAVTATIQNPTPGVASDPFHQELAEMTANPGSFKFESPINPSDEGQSDIMKPELAHQTVQSFAQKNGTTIHHTLAGITKLIQDGGTNASKPNLKS